MKRVWFKGNLVEGDIALSAFDRGLLLGDGLFETMLVHNGTALWCKDHMERFAASAEELGIAFPKDEIKTSIAVLCKDALAHHVLRLTLTRGSAGRGLATDTDDFTYLATLQAFDPKLMFKPVTMGLVSVCRNDTSPASRMKTTSYMDGILAAREAEEDSPHEALMLNTKGFVASATIGNVFLVMGKVLVTPSLDQGILPGIMRKNVISLAGKAGFAVEERPVEASELEKADGLFMTNSLRFLSPVPRYAVQDYSTLIELLCAAAKAESGADPRTTQME